jgi:hypothetical protein
MTDAKPIKCKGTHRGKPCGRTVALTDGEFFYFQNPSGTKCSIRGRHVAVICEGCGYETRLRYSGESDDRKSDRVLGIIT